MNIKTAALLLGVSDEYINYLVSKKTFRLRQTPTGSIIIDPNSLEEFRTKQSNRQHILDSYNPPELRTDTTSTIETPGVI